MEFDRNIPRMTELKEFAGPNLWVHELFEEFHEENVRLSPTCFATTNLFMRISRVAGSLGSCEGALGGGWYRGIRHHRALREVTTWKFLPEEQSVSSLRTPTLYQYNFETRAFENPLPDGRWSFLRDTPLG